uniref:Protein kinase domain-containing protein n=1 Tax=Parascaris univalens TaxID=6257 RepID=A0A915BGL8_PARUN
SALEEIIKDECIDIRQPFDWIRKMTDKGDRENKKRLKEREIAGRKKVETRVSNDVRFFHRIF